jgi:hypothetical protein
LKLQWLSRKIRKPLPEHAHLPAIPFNFIGFWRGFPPGSRPLSSFVSDEHGEHTDGDLFNNDINMK